MRPILACFILLCFQSLLSFSVFGQWTKVDLGTDENLVHVSPVGGDTVYISGVDGMFKTVDGGATWTNIPVDIVGTFFYRTHFFNSKTAIGVGPITTGNSEAIVRTTNGGEHWEIVHVYNGGNWPREFNDLDFPTSLTGYAAGTNGRVLKTTDGGLSWNPIVNSGSTKYLAIDFDAANHGYVMSRYHLEEMNGTGIVDLKLYNNNGDFVDLQLLSAGQIFTASATNIKYSLNGGTTWTTRPFSFGIITTLYVESIQKIYIGTDNGLYVSNDAGEHWEFFKETEGTDVKAVAFDANGRGYLVGRYGEMFVTSGTEINPAPVVKFSLGTEGNCNESTLFLINESYPDYDFTWLKDDEVVSTQSGDTLIFTANASGEISLVASNGLKTDTLTLPFNISVQTVHADAGDDVFACYNEPVDLSASGSFYYSWAPATGLSATDVHNPRSTYPGSIQYVVSVSNDFGCVDTDTVLITRTGVIDATSYTKTNDDTPFPMSRMQMVNDTLGFALARNTLLMSVDSGKSWTVNSAFVGENNFSDYYTGVEFINADTGYVLSRYLYKTVDGGKTFAMRSPTNAGYLFDVEFTSTKVGYVSTDQDQRSEIRRTTDGGQTWTAIASTNIVGDIRKIVQVSGDTLVAVGRNGWANEAVFLYTTNGITWQKATYNELPNQEIADVYFLDKTTGYAVGSGGNIWKTTDSGRSWSVDAVLLNSSGQSIFFMDKLRGFITTWSSHSVYQTINGGQCWQFMGTVSTGGINSVYVHNKHVYILAGKTIFQYGEIYRGNASHLAIKLDQSLTFSAFPEKVYGDSAFSLSASSSSGLNVSYSSSDPQIASIDGTTVTILAAGSTVITASQSGDGYYLPAPSMARTLTVHQAPQLIEFDTIPNKLISAAPFLIHATASSGLTVDFESSNPAIASVDENKVVIHGTGTVNITASQAGNSNYLAATPVTRTFIVTEKPMQEITFSELQSKVYGGDPFALTAWATSGLEITYSSSNTAVAAIDGDTLVILAAGSTVITATQEGNDYFEAASPVARTLTISKADQTINFPEIAVKQIEDHGFVPGATATSGLSVMYSVDDDTIATISNDSIIFLAPGTVTVTTYQPGNENYNAANSVSHQLRITANQIISFPALKPKTFGDEPFTLTASASSGLKVVYESSNADVASLDDNEVTIRAAGEVTITARQQGNGNYLTAKPVFRSLVIEKATQEIIFSNFDEYNMTDSIVSPVASSTAGLSITFQSSNHSVATVAGTTLLINGAGEANITAVQSGNNNYHAAVPAVRTFVVSKLPQSVSFNEISPVVIYDGAFQLVATSDSGLPVVFASSDTSVAHVVETILTPKSAGVVQITASQPGNDIYAAADVVIRELTILAPTITEVEQGLPTQGVYPNPATDWITVIAPTFSVDVRINIVDIFGRVVIQTAGNAGSATKINVTGLPVATYFLQVIVGNKLNTTRFEKR